MKTVFCLNFKLLLKIISVVYLYQAPAIYVHAFRHSQD